MIQITNWAQLTFSIGNAVDACKTSITNVIPHNVDPPWVKSKIALAVAHKFVKNHSRILDKFENKPRGGWGQIEVHGFSIFLLWYFLSLRVLIWQFVVFRQRIPGFRCPYLPTFSHFWHPGFRFSSRPIFLHYSCCSLFWALALNPV